MKAHYRAMGSAIGVVLVLLGFVLSACATSSVGTEVLRSDTGMTMYTYDRDVAGSKTSACTGVCAESWPPVSIEHASGVNYGSISRADGTQQLTYKDKPVYYYSGDQKPGDRYGDNVDGDWHAIPKRAKRAKRRARGYPSGYD